MTSLPTNQLWKWFGLFAGILAILCLFLASIVWGVMNTNWQTVMDAYLHFNGSNEQIVIKDVRLPRALIATAVGISLGICGALLQALSRNALADVEILGLNSGASLAVVVAMIFFGVSSLAQFTWIAFAGVAVTGVLIYVIAASGREGLTPLTLTLAGAAMAALASSITYGLLTVNQQTLDEVLFWLTGSVSGRKLEYLQAVFPYMASGWLLTLMLAKPVHTLMMGDEIATSLGQNTRLVKIMSGLAIVLLTGSAVAVAGPIGFVGLVTPHLARRLVGPGLFWQFLYSAMLGAILLLTADIGARFLAYPTELPIGVVTALIGAPFFVILAGKGSEKR
ncbi:FecCD family ABC transporter permease [Brevibacillus fulvus]|uniref:Iron complex transport system permease protein n=1 Tax=Brevibacillus fulvus TaxID=1125967 RepID=A0A938Y2L2_9BACL|nr:iron ABC transporter permease [Brevibacillus fulvus]MBM7592136.1 iron complex transport system permease protein [Brevibacillus fulvus]